VLDVPSRIGGDPNAVRVAVPGVAAKSTSATVSGIVSTNRIM